MKKQRTPTDSIRQRVSDSVRRIPHGRVSTYGAIADEHHLSPRQVAQVLASNQANIPWHRVIKSGGAMPVHGASQEQADLLEDEGVEIENGKVTSFKSLLFIT